MDLSNKTTDTDAEPTDSTGSPLDSGQCPQFRLMIEPDPVLLQQITDSNNQAAEAFSKFESIPASPANILAMREELSKLWQNFSSSPDSIHPAKRRDTCLEAFDIRAKAFLKMVSSMELQKAFGSVIHYFKRLAWQEYTGIDGAAEMVRPEGPESFAFLDTVAKRAGEAVTQGYKQISLSSDSVETVDEIKPVKTRNKPGPTPNIELANRVMEVVCRVAPDGDWRKQLEDICFELDQAVVPFPRRWREHSKSWSACFEKRRELVRKKIVDLRKVLSKAGTTS